jgi:hypothetical protein
MATDDKASRKYAPRQFSLAGLMSLFLACAMYFGLFSVTFGSCGALADTTGQGVLVDIDRTIPWRLLGTIVIG